MEDENYYLIPEVFEKSNQFYVDCLENAVKKEGVHNIALLGGYGTGKSSILKQFSKGRRNVRYVSLLHIGEFKNDSVDMGKNKIEDEDESEREREREREREGKGEDEAKVKAKNDKYSMEKVRREIFAQLFYKFKPNGLRDSGFSRLGRTLGFDGALYIAVLVISVFSLFVNVSLMFSRVEKLNLIDVGTVAFFSALFFGAMYRLLRFFEIKKISLAKITFENTTVNFLEQNRDEIINIFRDKPMDWLCDNGEKEKIVVFEDLDRFNDYEIYVALRQLNFLINESDAVRKKVVFVYALRDSIIENPDERNKLFDYVLPVVPFRVAYDYKKDLFFELTRIFPENIRNDRVFNDYLKSVISVLYYRIKNERMARGFYELVRVVTKKDQVKDPDLAKDLLALAVIRYFETATYEGLVNGEGKLMDIYRKSLNFRNEIENYGTMVYDKIVFSFLESQGRGLSDMELVKLRYESKGGEYKILNYKNVINRILNLGDRHIKFEWGEYGGYIWNFDDIDRLFTKEEKDMINTVNSISNNRERVNDNVFQLYENLYKADQTGEGVLHDLLMNGLVRESVLTCVSDVEDSDGEYRIFLMNYSNKIIDKSKRWSWNCLENVINTLYGSPDFINPSLINDSVFSFLLSRNKINEIKMIIKGLYDKEYYGLFDFYLNFFHRNEGDNSRKIIDFIYSLNPDRVLNEIYENQSKGILLGILVKNFDGFQLNRLNDDTLSILDEMMSVILSNYNNMDEIKKLIELLAEKNKMTPNWIDEISSFSKTKAEWVFEVLIAVADTISIEILKKVVNYGINNNKDFVAEFRSIVLNRLDGVDRDNFKLYIVEEEDEMRGFLEELDEKYVGDLLNGNGVFVELSDINSKIFDKLAELKMLSDNSKKRKNKYYMRLKNK